MTKISETNNGELVALVLAEYSRAHKVTGYTMPSASDLTERVKLTVEDLCESFANATTDDVTKAFRKGSVGDFGEFAGLSVKTVHQWMRSVTVSDGRVNRVVYEDTVQPQRTPEELKFFARHLVNICYNSYCESGSYYAPASRLLRTLDDDGIIDMVEERMLWAKEKSADILTNKAIHERKIGQSVANFIQANTDNTAAKFVVDGFFNEMIEVGKTEIYKNLKKPETLKNEKTL